MFVMVPELKARWVEALRSDRYSQRRGSIGSGTHLCCIGVFGAVAGMVVDGDGWFSHDVAKKLGLSAEQTTALIKMNDSGGKSFDEIADYIEVNL